MQRLMLLPALDDAVGQKTRPHMAAWDRQLRSLGHQHLGLDCSDLTVADELLLDPAGARDPFVIARPMQIEALHALASAAIPFVFPAVRIDRIL
jgi:hypothetical protein